MVELQNGTELDLRNIGFTYPEDSDTDLELLKQHDTKLSQMKNTLLVQQAKLKRALQNFKKKKEGINEELLVSSLSKHSSLLVIYSFPKYITCISFNFNSF